MPILRKPIRLAFGVPTQIARDLKMTDQHIRLVARAKREGSQDVIDAIRAAAKQQRRKRKVS